MKVTTQQTDSRWIFRVFHGNKDMGEILVPRFSTPEQVQKQAEIYVESIEFSAARLKKHREVGIEDLTLPSP